MEITIKGEAKELAAFVVAIQTQRVGKASIIQGVGSVNEIAKALFLKQQSLETAEQEAPDNE